MMPFLQSVREVWIRLGDLQREQNDRPPRRPDGLARNVGFRMPRHGHNDSSARMRRVRTALEMSKDRACSMLAERLSGINLSMVLGALISACEEVAVIWGGSVLLGGTIGGGIGITVGGIGVAPGAVLGAGMGAQVGLWILGFLGLKSLIEDLGTAVPEVLRLYEKGFSTAWGRLDDGGSFLSNDGDDSSRTWSATNSFAQGHVLLMVTMLTALLAYLSRGRGDPAAKARILQEIRESPRLGHKVADWAAANEEALARHPGLKPKEQQVVMAAAPAKDVGPPITPAELRRLRDEGPPSAPKDADAPKKPEPPAPPKVMPQKKVRCFEPNDLPQAKIPEFDRQLAGQERGLNDMTVDEYLKGRDAFMNKDVVRDPGIARQARTDFQATMQKDLERDLMREGMSPRAAKEQAALRAKSKMETLAALHNPDMVSAGKDAISGFGDKNVNSRIGAQWKSRVADLDEATKRVPQPERAATKMNARLQRCP